MGHHLPTWLLAPLALCAVVADLAWLDTGAYADNDQLEVAKPIPEQVPVEAFLTGPVQQSATVDGVDLAIARRDGKIVLTAHNPGDDARALAVHLVTWNSIGEPLGRMGGVRRQLAASNVELNLAGGASTEREVALGEEPPPSGSGFATVELAVHRSAGELPLATLRLASL